MYCYVAACQCARTDEAAHGLLVDLVLLDQRRQHLQDLIQQSHTYHNNSVIGLIHLQSLTCSHDHQQQHHYHPSSSSSSSSTTHSAVLLMALAVLSAVTHLLLVESSQHR